MNHRTVLCVENIESGFAVSREVLQSGLFRIISVTTPDAAVKVFSAVPVDATVFDCCVLAQNGIEVAATLRQINPKVPQFLFTPGETKALYADRSGLIYVAHDLKVLAQQLQALLIDMKPECDRQTGLIAESIWLQLRARDPGEESPRGVDLGMSLVQSQSHPEFKHISLSVCKRCSRVIAVGENGLVLEQTEQRHNCKGL